MCVTLVFRSRRKNRFEATRPCVYDCANCPDRYCLPPFVLVAAGSGTRPRHSSKQTGARTVARRRKGHSGPGNAYTSPPRHPRSGGGHYGLPRSRAGPVIPRRPRSPGQPLGDNTRTYLPGAPDCFRPRAQCGRNHRRARYGCFRVSIFLYRRRDRDRRSAVSLASDPPCPGAHPVIPAPGRACVCIDVSDSRPALPARVVVGAKATGVRYISSDGRSGSSYSSSSSSVD